MIEYVLLGCGFAIPAGIQPGPLQAYLFSRVSTNGWKRTLPAALAPVFSDIPIIILALSVLGRFPADVLQWVRLTGGIFLIYLGLSIIRQLARPIRSETIQPQSARNTIFQAAFINLLNPNPYLAWALILGPALTRAWHQHPLCAASLLAAFYGTMIFVLGGSIYLFGTTQFLSHRVQKNLTLGSGICLVLLGGYQIAAGLASIVAA